MIVIVGESACGKSSVSKYLTENCGFKRVITYTTRKPRDGELDGVDYHFVSNHQFALLEMLGYFSETAKYNNWSYGSSRYNYSDDSVIILTPRGLRSIKKSGIKNIYAVYIDVPRRDRLIKCLERGDDIEEAYRRNLSDVGQFDGIENEVDLVIKNPEYQIDIETIANTIIKEMHHNERI